MKPVEMFINQTGRLRSGWRLAVFLLVSSLLSGIAGGVIGVIFYHFPIEFSAESLLDFIVTNAILLFGALAAGWLCGKFLEGLSFRALGAWFTRNWLKDFSFGLLFGAAAIGFAALLLAVSGASNFQFNPSAGQSAILLTLIISLSIFTLGAAAEEAMFRGYILQTFTRARFAWFAIALTSLFFASAHLRNPNVNYIAMLNTILAGVWFSVAYLRTRTLWLAFGLHLAWNWVQGAILGSPVSGITKITTAPFFKMTNLGSVFLTGGDYGIEGGIVCSISVILFIVLTWFVPIFKPTEEMLRLTSEEKMKNIE